MVSAKYISQVDYWFNPSALTVAGSYTRLFKQVIVNVRSRLNNLFCAVAVVGNQNNGRVCEDTAAKTPINISVNPTHENAHHACLWNFICKQSP